VGFEHHPRTAEQKSAVRKAIEALKATDPIFALSSDAGAKLVKSTVYTDIEEDHKHKSGEDHSPEHGETTRTDNHEEDDSYHGEHHDGDEHERHSEFKAEYHFVCSSPNNLKQIDVLLFRIFPGIEHIEVQLISGTRQTALELTANKSQIQF
jgi:ABC-type Zn2+ transport system substrate-binding protein/surface adhesin